jgi:hypothetical protein
VGGEQLIDLCEGLVSVQRTGWRVVAGFEFVETPPQPVLGCCPVFDQGLSVVDQQPQLPRRTIKLGGGKVRFTESCPGHR